MRTLASLALVAVVACSPDDGSLAQPPPTPVEISFRVIEEGQNPAFCVEGPEFEVVRTDDGWVEVYSRQSDCQPAGDVSLPRVRFDHPNEPEVVLAAWWRVEGCLGFDVTTDSVARVGDEVVVRATSSGPGEGDVCPTALGGLESFLVVREHEGFRGATLVRFFLDGEELGTADPGYD